MGSRIEAQGLGPGIPRPTPSTLAPKRCSLAFDLNPADPQSTAHRLQSYNPGRYKAWPKLQPKRTRAANGVLEL